MFKSTILSPKEAEMYGLLETIIWLQELGVQRITIEMDCKSAVDGINGNLQDTIKECTLKAYII